MANEKNLIPLNKRTKSEQRTIQSAGGVASGVARRRRKTLREAADLFLSLKITDKKALKHYQQLGLPEAEVDQQMAMIAGLTFAAQAGDAKAAKVIVDLLDEKHSDDKLDKLDALLEEFKNAVESEAD